MVNVPNVVNTGTHRLIAKYAVHSSDKLQRINYTDFTGGAYNVPDVIAAELHLQLQTDYQRGEMPCLQEVHSGYFPLFLDVDVKMAKAEVPSAVTETIARCATAIVREFYPNVAAVECVVLAKSKGAKQCGPQCWKYGLHIHWPKIVVSVARARRIRLAVVNALRRDDTEWAETFGVTSDWDEWIDDKVYRRDDAPRTAKARGERSGGLRLAFAPKATKCCSGAGVWCDQCCLRNRFHVVDDNVYVLFAVIVDDERNAAREQLYKRSPMMLLRSTTVRCADHVQLTAGYAPPPNSEEPVVGKPPPKERVPRTFKPHEPSAAGRNELRRMLLSHSGNYGGARMNVTHDGKTTFRVDLMGEGSRYCINKGSAHNQRRVYMVVERTKLSQGDTFKSYMRCFCPCAKVRTAGQTCKEFKSHKQPLSKVQIGAIFGSAVERDTKGVDELSAATARYEAAQRARAERDAEKSRETAAALTAAAFAEEDANGD